MAYENPILNCSYKAAEALTSDQFRFVVLNSSEQVRRPDSAAEIAFGVLQNAPASGEIAEVMTDGITKLVVNAAVSIGDFLVPEYVGAADAGKAAEGNGANTRAIALQSAGAEDDVIACRLIGPGPTYPGALIAQATVTTDATAGALTMTAAMLLGGLILRDPAGGARSDVTPTAALLVAAMTNPRIGDAFEFTIRNTADAAETITVTGGTGCTLSGTMTIAQNNSKRFLVILTSLTAYTVYSLGTIVH